MHITHTSGPDQVYPPFPRSNLFQERPFLRPCPCQSQSPSPPVVSELRRSRLSLPSPLLSVTAEKRGLRPSEARVQTEPLLLPAGGAVGRRDGRVPPARGLALGLGGLWPGVGEERVPASSPGSVGVAGAKAQARRVRAGHGRTRSGKGPARTGLRAGAGPRAARAAAWGPQQSRVRAAVAGASDSGGFTAFSHDRSKRLRGWGFRRFAVVSCGVYEVII